jgi:hypothetical protein
LHGRKALSEVFPRLYNLYFNHDITVDRVVSYFRVWGKKGFTIKALYNALWTRVPIKMLKKMWMLKIPAKVMGRK